MHDPSLFPAHRFLRQALVGAAFLGLVAIASLPAARGAGPMGWMPLWLLGMPLVALAALELAGRGGRAPAAPAANPAARRRARPAQARRRKAVRAGQPRRRAAAPAA